MTLAHGSMHTVAVSGRVPAMVAAAMIELYELLPAVGPVKDQLEPPVPSVGRGARSVFRNQPLVTQMTELLTQRAMG